MSSDAAKCSVCSSQTLKYKCSACAASSCSLPCFKTHAAQCTAAAPPLPPADPTITDTSTPKPSPATPNEQSRPTNRTETPLQLLPAAERTELLTRYPTLQAQLREIYAATQRPEHDPSDDNSGGSTGHRGGMRGRGRGGGGRGSFPRGSAGNTHNWTPEKGFDHGLKILQRAMAEENIHGEGLRAFAERVLEQARAEETEG